MYTVPVIGVIVFLASLTSHLTVGLIEVGFTQDSYNVKEGGTALVKCAILSNLSLVGLTDFATFSLEVFPVTASADDFSHASFPMFGFLDLYTTPRTVEIPTFNDTEVEGPEEFMLRLTQSTSPGSFVGDFQVIRGQTTVIIFDQDLLFNVLNTGNVYQFSFAENTGENGDPLGTVACTEAGGAALTGPVTYSILESNSVPFQLNSNTGVLSLRNGQVLDYEQSELYSFNVSCSYVSDPGTSAMAAVRFSVLPVNEFSPDLSDSSLTVTISELTPAGTILVSRDSSGLRQYSVSDADSGTDGEIRFLSGDNNPLGFKLNEISGALTLTQSLDLDSGSVGLLRITYTILVCDGNRPRAECNSLNVSILVHSANNHLPVFEKYEYAVSIPESTPVGSSLITVVCTDADRHGVGEFSGITVEPADALVYIPNEKNGTIFLKTSESLQTSTVVLVCRDTGANENRAKLTLQIVENNDYPPSFNSLLSYQFTVDRSSSIGQVIGEIQASDADQNVITYALSGPRSDNFQISCNGTITLAKYVYVYEGSQFTLTATASDRLFSTSTTIHINVTGVLSIPEIIIVVMCGVTILILVLIVILLASISCSKRRSYKSEGLLSEKWSSDNKTTGVGHSSMGFTAG